MTRYEILEHPNEHGQATKAVAHHIALFDHPPGTVAGDRGVHSPETEATLAAAGVKRVAIPASGKLSEDAKRWNTRALGGAGIADARASREESRASGAIMAGANAAITGKTGWSAGWVWG